MNVNEIAAQINTFIQDEAKKVTAQQSGGWQEKYEWIAQELEERKVEAKAFYEDMKSCGLTSSMIEAEGFLRCAMQSAELPRRAEELFNSEEEQH